MSLSDAFSGSSFSWDPWGPLSHPRVFLPVSGGYLFVVFTLWLVMRGRERVGGWLVPVAVAHNYVLSLWSAAMFAGTCYELFKLYRASGWESLFCSTAATSKSGWLYLWSYHYFLSKYLELADTVIIVLRKAPLSFLHVFHHSVVLLMSWVWLQEGLQFHFFGIAFNTFVHIIMYYFYAVSLRGIRVWWKKYITSLQIVQFVSSFALAVPYVYLDLGAGRGWGGGCTGHRAFFFSCFLNATFLVLFIRFYLNTYKDEKSAAGKKGGAKSQ
jgi:hypothetical protein